MNLTPQEKHEQEMLTNGRQKFRNDLEKEVRRNYYTNTEPGKTTLHIILGEFIKEFERVIEESKNSKAKRNAIVQCRELMPQVSETLSSGVVAFLGLQTIIDAFVILKQDEWLRAGNLCGRIGMKLEDEMRIEAFTSTFNSPEVISKYRSLEDRGPDPADVLINRACASYSGPHYRRLSTKIIGDKIADRLSMDSDEIWTPWPENTREMMGLFILEVAANVGVITMKNDWKKGKQTKRVRFTDRLNAVIENLTVQYHEHAFYTHPLIDTPLDWEYVPHLPSKNNFSGGYHSEIMREVLPFCRTKVCNTTFGKMAVDLANRLQSVAWRIDTRVLRVVQHLIENRISIKDALIVAPFDKPQKGQRPAHIKDTDLELIAEWKATITRMHREFTEISKKSLRSLKSASMADAYKNLTFYLSWSADWRGRYYSQQAWLQPQSSEVEKSLLRFKEGCRLDENGKRWVLIALGAAHEGTKDSLTSRETWSLQNMDLIKRVGADPLSNINDWSDADEPFAFLQLCLEWHDVVVTGKEKLWRVGIPSDATASGLQLLSGALRDPKGMKFANLTPSNDDNPPQDAYLEVLRIAREKVIALTGQDHLLPLFYIRGCGKGALMLSIYGGSYQGIRAKICEALREKGYKIVSGDDVQTLTEGPTKVVKWEDTAIMTTEILNASKEVFPKAYEALTFLKKLIGKAAKKYGSNVKWNTPTGDVIHSLSWETDRLELHTKHYGKCIIARDNPELGVCEQDMIKSFAPGYVHSLDAALLKHAFHGWTKPMALIHDCIQVLPMDMDDAINCLRDSFTNVVAGDPLAQLADELGITEEELPRVKQGDGKLSEVAEARYMFN